MPPELPHGKRAIGYKWVFATKSDSYGNVKGYKTRLIAKNFSQCEDINYFETFAAVDRYESIRILLTIAADRDYEIKEFDIKTVFLFGELEEVIYLL